MNSVTLGSLEKAFSRGGNRLCFVDPRDPCRCIKIARSDKTPELKRQEKSFPKNLKPLQAFDDNYGEYAVFSRIEKTIGDEAFELIPRCYGFVETDFGDGLCVEMIRDDDGAISLSLKQYLWLYGKEPKLNKLLQQFSKRWQQLGIPSRNLLLHNMLVQQKAGEPHRLMVIDGLGWPDMLPLAYYSKAFACYKAGRRLQKLELAIAALLAKKNNGQDYGVHGWLSEEQRRGVGY